MLRCYKTVMKHSGPNKKSAFWYLKSAYIVWLRPIDFTKQDQIAFVLINTIVANLVVLLTVVPEVAVSGVSPWVPALFGIATATPLCLIMMTLGANSLREILKLRTEMEVVSTRLAERNGELEIAKKELSQLANSDGLTGLANRRFFSAALEEVFGSDRKTSGEIWLAMLDLDGFKQVNDLHGHDAGDDVLIAVASRLNTAFSEAESTAARFGGDEFAIIMYEPDPQPVEIVERRARALCAYLAGNHQYQGNALQVGVSLGLAKLDASVARPADLLKAADDALRLAKATGKGRVCIHSKDKLAMPDRRGLAIDLDKAS